MEEADEKREVVIKKCRDLQKASFLLYVLSSVTLYGDDVRTYVRTYSL